MEASTYGGIFAEKLRTLFNESKKTQKDLIQYIEEQTGKAPTRQAVSMWLRGNSPDIKTIPIIADFFNVSVDYLITDTDIKTTDASLKAVCQYIGLSEKAVENIKSIANEGEAELELFNALCEEGELAKMVDIFARYALCRCAMLNSAELYKKLQQLERDTSKAEKQIKEYRQSAEYLKTTASLQCDRTLAISTKILVKTLLKYNDDEYNELLGFSNSFSEVEGLNFDLKDFFNTIAGNEGDDEDG